jgi:hypothetical protein
MTGTLLRKENLNTGMYIHTGKERGGRQPFLSLRIKPIL